jgi:hypothetical protein
MEKSLERACHAKILRRVTGLLAPLGFRRAKSTFFIRRREWVIEFIHVHKYSFMPGYRVHLGIRVQIDVFPAPALNGPDSHPYTCNESPNGTRYTLDFGPDQASIEHCAAEIHRWISEVGVPWFNRYQDLQALLTDPASPLGESEKGRLRLAMRGEWDPQAAATSLMLFGVAGE